MISPKKEPVTRRKQLRSFAPLLRFMGHELKRGRKMGLGKRIVIQRGGSFQTDLISRYFPAFQSRIDFNIKGHRMNVGEQMKRIVYPEACQISQLHKRPEAISIFFIQKHLNQCRN